MKAVVRVEVMRTQLNINAYVGQSDEVACSYAIQPRELDHGILYVLNSEDKE